MTKELDEEDLEIIEEHELAGDTGNPSDYIFAINSNSSIEKRINKLKTYFKANDNVHLIAITKDLGLI